MHSSLSGAGLDLIQRGVSEVRIGDAVDAEILSPSTIPVHNKVYRAMMKP